MTHYIDGFTLPIPRKNLENYKKLSHTIANIWKEYGALDYREYIGDDLTLAGTQSFSALVKATDDEVIVFGWVEFKSREERDLINKKVAADPRMEQLVSSSNSGFDAMRMLYGGFKPLV